MCGIAGFSNRETRGDTNSLKRMGDAITHRGPDDSGEFLSNDGRVGLAFRRLSIIDLSRAANQPMSNIEGTMQIVYNGEIYNFRSIKSELIDLGYRFRTKTDTEVVLYAYEEWGEKCLDRLSGMFAFAIWDQEDEKLFFARDRVGIKPFFYYYDYEIFVFGSEIKAIKQFPGLELFVDETAIYDFLTYLYIPTPKTFYRNMFKLPPGHCGSVGKDGLIIREYWNVDPSRTIKISEEDAIVELRRLLDESVRAHLMSDVPLGVFLSGGVDSSTVTAIAQKNSHRKIKSFSIGFDVPEHSETQYAQIAARHIGTDHREGTVSKDMFETVDEFIMNLYDEPFGDSSSVPTYFVSKFAREQVTVVLSGDGGDEVFGGYSWYKAWIINGITRDHGIVLRRRLFRALSRIYPAAMRGYQRILTGSLSSLDYYAYLMGGILDRQKQLLLHSEFVKKFNSYDSLWYFKKYWNPELDPITRMQYLDFKTYLHDDILTKVDRASMAVSLETRVPLLDHKLVEFVFSLPVEVRNKNNELKYLLKKAVQDILPMSIVDRKKKGFSVPGAQWMTTDNMLHRFRTVDSRIVNTAVYDKHYRWLKGNKLWQLRLLHYYLNL